MKYRCECVDPERYGHSGHCPLDEIERLTEDKKALVLRLDEMDRTSSKTIKDLLEAGQILGCRLDDIRKYILEGGQVLGIVRAIADGTVKSSVVETEWSKHPTTCGVWSSVPIGCTCGVEKHTPICGLQVGRDGLNWVQCRRPPGHTGNCSSA